MSGYQDGERWIDPDGTSQTVNSNSDPNVPGGYYYNQHEPTGDGSIGHATVVYNADGTLADIPQNCGWQDVPRQDQG